jgi:hypothetical protein
VERLERLDQHRIRSGETRAAARFLGAADRDDRQPARPKALAQALAIEDAVDSRQADVEDDHIRHRLAQALLGLDDVVGRDDLEPLQLQDEPQHLAEPAIVIDDQDSKRLFRHQVSPFDVHSTDDVCVGSSRRSLNGVPLSFGEVQGSSLSSPSGDRPVKPLGRGTLMRAEGFEPPCSLEHRHLKPACLTNFTTPADESV